METLYKVLEVWENWLGERPYFSDVERSLTSWMVHLAHGDTWHESVNSYHPRFRGDKVISYQFFGLF